MDVGELRRVVEERAGDAAAPRPIACIATVGTTSVGAVDPVGEIAGAISRPDVWLHVDAAWAGSALVCPEHRWMAEGLEHADSLCINPHKWLLTNFDCDLFWTRSRRDLVEAMSITPEYLRNAASESGAVIDYRDWQIPLGRRFRALKLWFVIRHYGVEGLRAHIREHVRLAEMVERFVKYDDRFELTLPRSLGLVCFRVAGAEGLTTRLIERVNASGKAFLSHGSFAGPGGKAGPVARLAIGGTHTGEEHVRRAWELITRAVDELR
jgi:aromatic-L-amino-acid decarboxylase